MVEKILTPRAILYQVVAGVARETRLEPELIAGRRWSREAVHARALVAKRLLERGQSEERIAAMMHVSLETVQVYLGKRVSRRAQQEEARHDHQQDGTEGSGVAGAARSEDVGEQGQDRPDHGESESDWQGQQRQGRKARRARSVT